MASNTAASNAFTAGSTQSPGVASGTSPAVLPATQQINTPQSSGNNVQPVSINAAGPAHAPATGSNVPRPAPNTQPPLSASQPLASSTQHSASNTQPPNSNAQPSVPTNANQPPIIENSGWISIWLKRYTLLLTAGVTLSLLSAIITLTVLSSHYHGFASTKAGSQKLVSFLPTIDVGIGLAWTFLPSLILQLYGLTVAAIVKAAGVRQPYIELRSARSDYGAPPEKSILLDYQSYWFFEAPFRALQYNHYMLAYSFIIALLAKTLLSPLAAHLFYTTTALVPHNIDVHQTAFLNKQGFTARSSLESTLEIISSTLTYGAQSPPWTTLDTSFIPISIPDSLTQREDVANFTIPTHAFAAHMDCAVLSPDEFEIRSNNGSGWDFRAFDRGCGSGKQTLEGYTEAFQLIFLQTYFIPCSYAAQQSRILVVGALRGDSSDPSGLKNQTVVSCIPTFSHSTGSLTVSFDTANLTYPIINTFRNATYAVFDELPSWAGDFEFQLVFQSAYLDITDEFVTSGYGNVIYRYANKISPDAYMTGDILMNATNATFVAGFAIAASQYLFQPGSPRKLHATYISNDTRVVVVVAIASTICSLLFLALVMLVWILLYTRKHQSILYEEPRALLSAAVILRKSTLLAEAQDVIETTPSGEVRKAFMEHHKSTSPDQGWYLDDWDNPKLATLEKATGRKPFGFFKRS